MVAMVDLVVHAVWSASRRGTPLDGALVGREHAAIVAKCGQLGCAPLAVGGTFDHVHLVARLCAAVSVARLVLECKGFSSHVCNRALAPRGNFHWQAGYRALSLDPDALAETLRYVRDQPRHHQEGALLASLEPA
jgi:putative transposase